MKVKKTTEVDEALKIVWAYMVEEGYETTGKWNYHGSCFESLAMYNFEKIIKDREKLRERIKKIGVDWEKTKEPQSDEHDCFEGTFDESSKAETLLGELVLLDGSKILIGVSGADRRFGEYLKNLATLAADRKRVQDILGE